MSTGGPHIPSEEDLGASVEAEQAKIVSILIMENEFGCQC